MHGFRTDREAEVTSSRHFDHRLAGERHLAEFFIWFDFDFVWVLTHPLSTSLQDAFEGERCRFNNLVHVRGASSDTNPEGVT